MIRLTRFAPTLRATSQDLARARDAWERAHHLVIPDFLDPDLVALIARLVDEASFEERTHGSIGSELCAETGNAFALLQFLANDPRLFQWIRNLTGAGPLGSFEGRIFRQVPGAHLDSWHDDVGRTRAVALSINLSAEPHQGGVLQIRERASSNIVAEVANARLGGAVLFRIAPHLQHRATPVTGAVPRTTYAGWFRAQPAFRDVVAGRATF